MWTIHVSRCLLSPIWPLLFSRRRWICKRSFWRETKIWNWGCWGASCGGGEWICWLGRGRTKKCWRACWAVIILLKWGTFLFEVKGLLIRRKKRGQTLLLAISLANYCFTPPRTHSEAQRPKVLPFSCRVWTDWNNSSLWTQVINYFSCFRTKTIPFLVFVQFPLFRRRVTCAPCHRCVLHELLPINMVCNRNSLNWIRENWKGGISEGKKHMDSMALVDKKFSQVKSAVQYIYLGFLCVTRHRLIEDTHRELPRCQPAGWELAVAWQQ